MEPLGPAAGTDYPRISYTCRSSKPAGVPPDPLASEPLRDAPNSVFWTGPRLFRSVDLGVLRHWIPLTAISRIARIIKHLSELKA